MAKISLCIEDIELGYLMERNGKYVFYANGDEVLRAKKEYPLDMVLFKLNDKGMKSFDNIPYPFSTFVSGTYREDIMRKANIETTDSDFVRLYKVANLKIMRQNFDIHVAD